MVFIALSAHITDCSIPFGDFVACGKRINAERPHKSALAYYATVRVFAKLVGLSGGSDILC